MSDIRAQSRRDAEFDRFAYHSMREAYEMGKRHRAEQCPRWHDAPTCAGLWLCTSDIHGFLVVDIPENSKTPHDTPRRWYGPIKEDINGAQ